MDYELHPLCTMERLKAVFRYCPSSGHFVRRITTGSRAVAGSVAGWKDRYGHVRINFDGRTYGAHRLAIFYTTGQWPAGDVDHINGDPSDNRIENLRDVSHRVNLENRRRAASHNKSGVLGVSQRGNSYMARIKHNGRMTNLGSFRTAAEAHAAYVAFKRGIHEGCTL